MINEKLIMSLTEDEAKAAFEAANDQIRLYEKYCKSISDALYQYNLLDLKLFKLVKSLRETEE